jgi:predicted nucleotidyltransferase
MGPEDDPEQPRHQRVQNRGDLVRASELLRAARELVLAAVAAVGGTDVRVIGSVAHCEDRPGSDVDVVVTFPPDADIVTLLTLEEHLAGLLTVPVNVISAGSAGLVGADLLADAPLL